MMAMDGSPGEGNILQGRGVSRASFISAVCAPAMLSLAFQEKASAFSPLMMADEDDLPLPDFTLKEVAKVAPTLQFNIDYYLFEFKAIVEDPTKWGDMLDAFRASSDARFASVSRFERDFYTPMRNLGQAFPEEQGGDELLAAARGLEGAAARLEELGKQAGAAVAPAERAAAAAAWEEGRRAINAFIGELNARQSRVAMAEIAPTEADSTRSRKKFIAYKKELAKCQQGGLGVNVCQDIMSKYTAK